MTLSVFLSQERRSLDTLNIFLNLVFLAECGLRITAQSFWGYLSSGWSRLDFFIVITSTLDMSLTYFLQVDEFRRSAIVLIKCFLYLQTFSSRISIYLPLSDRVPTFRF